MAVRCLVGTRKPHRQHIYNVEGQYYTVNTTTQPETLKTFADLPEPQSQPIVKHEAAAAPIINAPNPVPIVAPAIAGPSRLQKMKRLIGLGLIPFLIGGLMAIMALMTMEHLFPMPPASTQMTFFMLHKPSGEGWWHIWNRWRFASDTDKTTEIYTYWDPTKAQKVTEVTLVSRGQRYRLNQQQTGWLPYNE